jgi:hypothetical protein
VQGGEIHIGDRHYQFDVEALRELLQPTTPLSIIDGGSILLFHVRVFRV